MCLIFTSSVKGSHPDGDLDLVCRHCFFQFFSLFSQKKLFSLLYKFNKENIRNTYYLISTFLHYQYFFTIQKTKHNRRNNTSVKIQLEITVKKCVSLAQHHFCCCCCFFFCTVFMFWSTFCLLGRKEEDNSVWRVA